MDIEKLAKEITATAAAMQQQLTPEALAMWIIDLKGYDFSVICRALGRTRREVNGRFTLAVVLGFIQSEDGRPTGNEAWNIALQSFNEAKTVVLNNEIAEGLDACREIYLEGDETGARMAFRDAYERAVSVARAEGKKPEWFPSLGTDKEHREIAIGKAVTAGLISSSHIDELPWHAPTIAGLIECAAKSSNKENALKNIYDLKTSLFGNKKMVSGCEND